jgi:hypothetical protein
LIETGESVNFAANGADYNQTFSKASHKTLPPFCIKGGKTLNWQSFQN